MTIIEEKLNLLNPKLDYVFKRIFGYAGNEEITKNLLNSILLHKVQSLSLDNETIQEKDLFDDKVGILDVKATFEDKTVCDLEMQVVDRKNVEKRILDYWSMIYQRTIKEGEDYSKLKKCIVVLFLDYELNITKDIQEYLTIWNIREKNYPQYVLTDDLEFYIIEMSKYEKLKNEHAIKINPWIEFINNPEVKMENKEIKQAKEILDEISQDEHERRLAELRKKYIADQKAIEAAGYDKGYNSGIAKGKKLLEESKTEIAKKLLHLNMDIDTISEITGLSKNEIQYLK